MDEQILLMIKGGLFALCAMFVYNLSVAILKIFKNALKEYKKPNSK